MKASSGSEQAQRQSFTCTLLSVAPAEPTFYSSIMAFSHHIQYSLSETCSRGGKKNQNRRKNSQWGTQRLKKTEETRKRQRCSFLPAFLSTSTHAHARSLAAARNPPISHVQTRVCTRTRTRTHCFALFL